MSITASATSDELASLCEILGSQGATARALGKNPRQVWGWVSSGGRFRPTTASLINDFTAVVGELVERFGRNASTINYQLLRRWPELGNRPLAVVVQEGQADLVLDVLSESVNAKEITMKVSRQRPSPESGAFTNLMHRQRRPSLASQMGITHLVDSELEYERGYLGLIQDAEPASMLKPAQRATKRDRIAFR